MASGVHQPRQCERKPYDDIRRASALDSSFSKVLNEVDRHFKLLSRSHQVRIKQWTKKFKEQTNNTVWKKNRNAYARLLLDQLRDGVLGNPFDTTPPDGPLQTLPKWLIYRHPSPSKRRGEGSCAAVDETTERQGRARDASQDTCSHHGSSPRVGSPFSSPRFGSPSLRATSPITQIRAERMRGACRSNLDRYIGSSKDQTADRLWRMRRAESRLAANEEFGARERQRKNKYSRAELERIIERFEKRRASWTHVKDEYQVFQTSNLDRFYPGKSEGHFSDVRFALDQFQMRTDALKAKLDLDDKRSKRSDSPLFPRHTQPSPSREPEARVFQEERMSPRYTAHVQFEGPNIESQMASAAAVASVALNRGSEEASIFVEAGDQAPAGEDQVLSAELGTDSDTIEEESDLLQALRAFKLKTEDLKNDILLSEGQDGPV